MKVLGTLLSLSVASAIFIAPAAFAQDHHDEHHDHPYVHHEEWKHGYHMDHRDWDRGERIDYHAYHLRTPPHGYEWREVDGNYVLAAVATGVIASAIVASTVH